MPRGMDRRYNNLNACTRYHKKGQSEAPGFYWIVALLPRKDGTDKHDYQVYDVSNHKNKK